MYVFKPGPELVWTLLVTVTGVVSTAIATQGAVPPTDWRAWGIALATGLARALVALGISFIPSGVKK